MADLFEIHNTHVKPSTDELLDLGALLYQFKDAFISGIAYIDQLNIESLLEMNDLDIISIGQLYGLDNNIFIDMGTLGRMSFSANGIGTPFSTPDLDFTGSSFFDDDIGIDSTKKILFRDTGIFIQSADAGHLDLNADISIDLNGVVITTADLTVGDDLLVTGEADITGWLKASGYHMAVRTEVGDYTPTINDDIIRMDATAASRTVNLPSAASLPRKVLIIKATDIVSGGSVTIEPASAETIDGVSNKQITTDYGTIIIASNGTTWDVISVS